MPFRERRIASQDDLSLYVRDYGDLLDPRPPLLCLGGLSRNSKDFGALADRVSAGGRRVIAPDYRGRGRSDYDTDWRNYDPRVYLRDIHDILAALDVHRVVVVGTSLGGLVGMGMGAAMPTALAGVVLNDVGPEIETEGLSHIVSYMSVDRPQDNWDDAVETIRRMLPNLRFQDDGVWLAMARNTFRECEDGKLRFDWDINIIKPSLQPGYKIPDMWPLFLALTNVPILLLRGAESDILSRDCFLRMRQAMPDMTAVEIPRCGHVPTLSEPESLAALDAFLARH
ncbi:MAG: alpha/beta hydrolase [Rhodospirillaceae bacterium]